MGAAMRKGNRANLLEAMHLTRTCASFTTPLIKRRADFNPIMMHPIPFVLIPPSIIIFFMGVAFLLDRLLKLADADLGQAEYFLHIRKN